MKITFRHLCQIEALAKHSSFAKAAQELNISQPALSRSISSLEGQLEVQLFDRSKREVVPTMFGKHILERGKPVLQEMALMERDLDLLHGMESGELVIGSGPFPAEISIGKSVAKFSKNYPKVNVRVIIDRAPALLIKLRMREIDIFVADTRTIMDTSGLEIITLPKQQAYFCCRPKHPLTRKKQLKMKNIFSYPLAVMWFPKAVLLSLARAANLQLNSFEDFPCSILQCDYLKVLFDIISNSDATGLITRPIQNFPREEQLVLLPLTVPELNTHYGLASLSNYSQPPAVKIFQKYMVEVEEQNSMEWE